uniref:Uncharacterized protein n=1 Tax=Acrobeloides nanus TaxID=290746 RepID=A0A914ECE1_9BILA
MGKLCQACSRLVIENCWGCIDHDTTREHIGPSSRYIKVDRVGCYDCINIVSSKCPADNYNNVGLPGWPSVATFSPIINNRSTWTTVTVDPERYFSWSYMDVGCHASDIPACTKQQSWTPYVIHPRILNREYATDAMKDIIYECIWCKSLL